MPSRAKAVRRQREPPPGFRACFPGALSDDEDDDGVGTPNLPRETSGAESYRSSRSIGSVRSPGAQNASSEGQSQLSRQGSMYSYHSCRSKFDREFRVNDGRQSRGMAPSTSASPEAADATTATLPTLFAPGALYGVSGASAAQDLEGQPLTANEAKKASQYALLKIETLSRTSSQMLIVGLYLTVLVCIILCAVDEMYMWECKDICGSSRIHPHSTRSSLTCGVGDSSSCMVLDLDGTRALERERERERERRHLPLVEDMPMPPSHLSAHAHGGGDGDAGGAPAFRRAAGSDTEEMQWLHALPDEGEGNTAAAAASAGDAPGGTERRSPASDFGGDGGIIGAHVDERSDGDNAVIVTDDAPPSPSNITAPRQVLWEGSITGLTTLNRFLHMTYLMDNPNAQNASLVELYQLRVRQLAYTTAGEAPYNKTFLLTLSCTLKQKRCTTMQLPVAGLPWSEAYNITVMLLDPPQELTPYLTSVSIVFQYQVADYTRIEIVVRVLLIVGVILHMIVFFHSLWKVPFRNWLTEQQYIPAAFVLLILYVDPFILIEIWRDSEDSGFRYLAFHGSTYFILYLQVFIVVVLTSVRRASGFVTWKTHCLGTIWFLAMLTLDALQSSYFEDDSGDYASTFLWFPFTHDLQALQPGATVAYFCGVVLELAWFAWFMRGFYRARKRLRQSSYFATRHRQLSFRYLVFTAGGFLVYEVMTGFMIWAIHKGFTVSYRSSEELSTVVIAFAFCNAMAYIYTPAFVDSDAPPAPCDPSWQNAVWKRSKWKSEWYEWLAEHGGSLYFFVEKSEEDAYLAAQALPGSDDEDIAGSLPGSPLGASGYTHWPTSPISRSGSPLSQNPHYARPSAFANRLLTPPDRPFTPSKKRTRRARGRSPVIALIRKMMATTVAPFRILEHALFSEGYRGCPRLFFCLETATTMLNMSFCAYYPPSDFQEVQECFQGGGSFAAVERVLGPMGSWTLKTYEEMFLSAAYLTVLSAAAAVQCVSDVKNQAAEASTTPSAGAIWRDLWGRIGRRDASSNSLLGDDANPQDKAEADRVPTKVEAYGYRLFDCIQIRGILVLVVVPTAAERRDHIIVSFRGTSNTENVSTDVKVSRCVWAEMMEAEDVPCCGGCTDRPLLHSGFAELWEDIQTEVLMSIKEVMDTFTFHPTVYITGHSLGGAMASLCAYTATVKLRLLPVVYTFGSPKLGNKAFQQRYNFTVPNTFRVVNECDIVAHWSFTCSNFHVGHEVCVSRGNLLVEPTWIEQTFQPTKAGTAKYLSHSLYRYAATLNRISRRYGLGEPCLKGARLGWEEEGFEKLSYCDDTESEWGDRDDSWAREDSMYYSHYSESRGFSLERSAMA